jgi:hypothetical protein
VVVASDHLIINELQLILSPTHYALFPYHNLLVILPGQNGLPRLVNLSHLVLRRLIPIFRMPDSTIFVVLLTYDLFDGSLRLQEVICLVILFSPDILLNDLLLLSHFVGVF